jgi:GT2 family glycosyltransferase
LDIVAAMRGSVQLSVQVVNYHTRSYLERCLATVVSDLEGAAHEINLLDNASGEDLTDLGARFPECRTFQSATNLGFGGGHNLLASKTDAQYLLILNPDVEFLFPDTTQRLLNAVIGAQNVSAAGPKVVGEDGAPQMYDHGRLHGLRAEIALRGGHSYWHETSASQDVAWISGAALMIEHSAFDAVGGFDENFFLYKEDEDLCLRLRRIGRRIRYEPAVVVLHHGSVVAKRRQEIDRARGYFCAKNFPDRRSQKVFAAAHQWLAYLRL